MTNWSVCFTAFFGAADNIPLPSPLQIKLTISRENHLDLFKKRGKGKVGTETRQVL